MLPAESHWIHTLKPSQFTNEELRVGSFACFAHPRSRLPDLAELRVPFCAYKNSSGLPEKTRDCANRARNWRQSCAFLCLRQKWPFPVSSSKDLASPTGFEPVLPP